MTTYAFVMQAGFICARLPAAALQPRALAIAAPVGDASPPRARNSPADVRTVQDALNRFTPGDGGPDPALDPDGLCGPKTRRALRHFQKKWNLGSDGIADPGGPIMQRLQRGPGAPATPDALIVQATPGVFSMVTAARNVLAGARMALGGLGGGIGGILASHAALFEKHFHAKSTGAPLRRLQEVDSMFVNMQTAIGHIPQGLILLANEPPDAASGAFMFSFEGGYHRRGPADTFEGIHTGAIYVCPKARTLNRDGLAYALIHELAHYTGPLSDGVTDHAYFHRTPARYAALTAAQAFRNADSYSQFAFAAGHRPGFNIETMGRT